MNINDTLEETCTKGEKILLINEKFYGVMAKDGRTTILPIPQVNNPKGSMLDKIKKFKSLFE